MIVARLPRRIACRESRGVPSVHLEVMMTKTLKYGLIGTLPLAVMILKPGLEYERGVSFALACVLAVVCSLLGQAYEDLKRDRRGT
jgi:hypothetical protein